MSVKADELSQPGEYDEDMLTLLQIIWGDGFLSPGGAPELARLFEGCDIAGCSVLDIGCGLGAIDALLVTEYGARSVIGIDIDPALIAAMTARIERAGLGDRIQGQAVGGGALPFSADSFDVVFSKDAIVQIPDKSAMFAEVLRVLRPRGRFIASDWLRGGRARIRPKCLSSSASRALPTTWRLSPRAQRGCAKWASPRSTFETVTNGTGSSRTKNCRPWRDRCTR